jgi:hypothetical protein
MLRKQRSLRFAALATGPMFQLVIGWVLVHSGSDPSRSNHFDNGADRGYLCRDEIRSMQM